MLDVGAILLNENVMVRQYNWLLRLPALENDVYKPRVKSIVVLRSNA